MTALIDSPLSSSSCAGQQQQQQDSSSDAAAGIYENQQARRNLALASILSEAVKKKNTIMVMYPSTILEVHRTNAVARSNLLFVVVVVQGEGQQGGVYNTRNE